MEYIRAFHSLLFPSEGLCYFCKERRTQTKDFICKDCQTKLEILDREIDMDSPYIQKAYYSLMYNRLVRELIKDFKFHGKGYLYKPLGQLMLNTLEGIEDHFDLVVYVPSHRRKEAIRGYNQSQLLAQYISKTLNIPLSSNNLIKTKHTKDQNKLKRIDRITNLQGAFKIRNKKEIEDKEILLIDDIITTGSTMIECAKVLRISGSGRIRGLALTSSRKL